MNMLRVGGQAALNAAELAAHAHGGAPVQGCREKCNTVWQGWPWWPLRATTPAGRAHRQPAQVRRSCLRLRARPHAASRPAGHAARPARRRWHAGRQSRPTSLAAPGPGAADKKHAAQHCGLAVGAHHTGERGGPFELQLRHLGGGQARHLGGLEAALLNPVAPAGPVRPGVGAVRRWRGRRTQPRWAPQPPPVQVGCPDRPPADRAHVLPGHGLAQPCCRWPVRRAKSCCSSPVARCWPRLCCPAAGRRPLRLAAGLRW